MSVMDTADAIKVIEGMSQEQCRPECWCNSTYKTPERVMRWTPEYEAARFGEGT